jgi:hypothetical protein
LNRTVESAPGNTLCDMSAPQGQLDDAAREKAATDRRAAYLAHQEAVKTAVRPKRSVPLRAARWVTLVLTVGLFVATVASYLRNPQESGTVDLTLPTLAMAVGLAAAWCGLAPIFWEVSPVSVRVRNFVIGGVLTLILIPIGTVLVVSLTSLVADLISGIV